MKRSFKEGIYMLSSIKNIDKKFCLLVGMIFLILSLVTHISCFSFGFMSGIGVAGWMCLPDKENK
jgi:capsule polysaccharide export protein KpsC/LpsZ